MMYSSERYRSSAIDDSTLHQMRTELRAEIERLRADTRTEIKRAIEAAEQDQANRAKLKKLDQSWERTFKWALFSMWLATVAILGSLMIALR